MTPASASFSLKVVATDTESTMASTATPPRRSCSAREIPSLSNIARSSGSTSSRLASAGLGLRGRVVADVLVVDRLVGDVLPGRLGQRQPVAVRAQAPFEQPVWLVLLGGDQSDDVLAQPRGDDVGIEIGDEAVLVLAARELGDVARQTAVAPLIACLPLLLDPCFTPVISRRDLRATDLEATDLGPLISGPVLFGPVTCQASDLEGAHGRLLVAGVR